jgi:hypothetical protein
MKWFLVGFGCTLLGLVSHQILALSLTLILGGLLAPLLAVLFSVRKENNFSNALAPQIVPRKAVVTAEPEAPSNTAPAPTPQAVEPSYVAFAICDSDAGTADRSPAPVASPPKPMVPVEAAPEVDWIRGLIPLGFHEAVETFKRRLLAEAISLAEGNRAEAARRLGLQRTYLYRLARQLGAHDASIDRSSPN